MAQTVGGAGSLSGDMVAYSIGFKGWSGVVMAIALCPDGNGDAVGGGGFTR
ncbi:hypothetical protein RRF56_12460 [Nodosilinea sp. E11]|nr:hypothetical protein RRF56_12460 [Nodosilinea sp. E11]